MNEKSLELLKEHCNNDKDRLDFLEKCIVTKDVIIEDDGTIKYSSKYILGDKELRIKTMPPEHVYLDIFNGAAAIDTTYSPYSQTILIVAAGPLSNLVLWFIGSYLGLDIFAQVNMFLFIFNILPIYPMDGGRICKAICQWVTKPSIGRKINGYISIVCSILLFILSIMTSNLLMALFSALFVFYSYKEIEQKY
jgi:stage IV sporulation protein FB